MAHVVSLLATSLLTGAQPGIFFGKGQSLTSSDFNLLAILHKDFDGTGQFLVLCNRTWRQISSTIRHQSILTSKCLH